MERVEQNQSMIAWFCLAESVRKGEKERTLIMHRLLSHSVNDKAIALQLEGDILSAFGDVRALDRYFDAALVYKKNEQESLFLWLCEHVFIEAINLVCYDYARRIVNQEILSIFDKVKIARLGVESICMSKVGKTFCYTHEEHAFLIEMIALGKTLDEGCDSFTALIQSYDGCLV